MARATRAAIGLVGSLMLPLGGPWVPPAGQAHWVVPRSPDWPTTRRTPQLASWHTGNPRSDHSGSGEGGRRRTFRNTASLIQARADWEALTNVALGNSGVRHWT